MSEVRRIVQEALTNAARHTPGVPVHVYLSQDAGLTRVVITNGPSPHRSGSSS
jgi:signal transduction histidine kinase